MLGIDNIYNKITDNIHRKAMYRYNVAFDTNKAVKEFRTITAQVNLPENNED